MVNPLRWLLRKTTLYVFEYVHTRPGTREVMILGRPFVVYPGVYNPYYSRLLWFPSSEHLARHLTPAPDDKVLDMGTGIGVQAVFAALQARRVVATDINPVAVRCAAHNVELNGVANVVEVCHGNLFAPVKGERFDLIVWLPSSFFADPVETYQYSWMCGAQGEELDRFCCELDTHLCPGGRLQVSCVDRNREFILSRLEEHDFCWQMVGTPLRRFPLETVTLYEAWRRGDALAESKSHLLRGMACEC